MRDGANTTCRPSDGHPLPEVQWSRVDDIPLVIKRPAMPKKIGACSRIKQRGKAVVALAKHILDRREEILTIMCDEMGRGRADSLLSELTVVMNYAKGTVGVAKEATQSRKVKLSPIEFPGKKAVVEAVPRGVVGLLRRGIIH